MTDRTGPAGSADRAFLYSYVIPLWVYKNEPSLYEREGSYILWCTYDYKQFVKSMQ